MKRLIKISEPEKNKKTLFIWPEGIFYESHLQNIALYKDLFENKFSSNHLIVLGINNFVDKYDSNDKKSSLKVNTSLSEYCPSSFVFKEPETNT